MRTKHPKGGLIAHQEQQGSARKIARTSPPLRQGDRREDYF